MLSITATKARKDFFSLIKDITQKRKIFHIHHQTGTAVFMPVDDYENLLETLYLLSTPGLRKSLQRSTKQVEKGQTVSMEEVFKDD